MTGKNLILIRNKNFGMLYAGSEFLCFTLDPGIIEDGEYKLQINRSPKFKTDLPLIYNKEFPATHGFRLHQGNWMKDSNGCILVGRKVSEGVLADSLKTLEYLIILLKLNKVETLVIV